MSPRRDGLPLIPGYHLEAVLGRGATGVVYRATQLSVDRVVAIKVLRKELVGTSKAVQRLQREARNTARLHHPNIISAIDMGEVSGRWWYAMELVEGLSLAKRLKKHGPLTEREALRVFCPLVAALQHLYEKGIVHRDVKPANIVMEKGGRALLIDLGLAFAEDDPNITRDGGTLGTPHYISPEQARDPSSADGRSDIWSLGATLYHALAGEPPFQGRSVAEILSRVLYSRVPDPEQRAPGISRGLALVLRKCMAREPDRRYQEPDELLEDLERLRERRAPRITKGELDPVLSERPGARRIALIVVGSLVLVAGVALAVTRPWQAREGGAPTAVLTEWEPLEAFAAALDEEAGSSGVRLVELEDLARTTPERFQPRVAEIRGRVEGMLERQVYAFKRSREAAFRQALRDRDFDAARASVNGEFEAELERRVGVGLERLPQTRQLDFETWLDARRVALEDEVARAEDAFQGKLELTFSRITGEADNEKARNRWSAAQALLFQPLDSWIEASGADGRGLSKARRAELTSALELSRDAARQRLVNEWRSLDRELKTFLSKRAAELAAELEEGERGAAERLGDAFDDELARIGLAREQMPEGLTQFALDELDRQRGILERREAELEAERAKRTLRQLQAENAAAWKERRYHEIQAWIDERLAGDPGRTVRPLFELVRREANLLERFLGRAAAGIERADGTSRSLAVRSGIREERRIDAGVDPLRRGFQFGDDRAGTQVFLRGPVQGRDRLLETRDLRLFAGAADDPALIADAELRLETALFLYREGAPAEALEVLSSGEVPRDELVGDLDDRIAQALSEANRSDAERRKTALSSLELLRRERSTPHDVRHSLERCKALLTGFEDVLEEAELQLVRDIRRDLRTVESGAIDLESFRRVFGTDDVEFIRLNEVEMRFVFDRPDVGAWRRGDAWRATATGWQCPPGISELLETTGPRLLLRKPFDVDARPLVLTLELERPDSPSSELAISAVGFHVLFSSDDRFLVATGSLEDAVARLKAGEGKPFVGFQRDARHTLVLHLNRANGDANVKLDGRALDTIKDMRLSPMGEPGSQSITLRSLDPITLRRAIVKGARELR